MIETTIDEPSDGQKAWLESATFSTPIVKK
jgi:hypothetical protein